MIDPIPINLAVEDELSEAVARKIIACADRPYVVGCAYGKTGFGYLRNKIKGFNSAAKGTPFLVLTDLDKAECAPTLIREWLGNTPKHLNLLFRVAVRQVEAWLLAHGDAFCRFVRIRKELVPQDVDAIADAKRCLISLVAKSRRSELREDIVPPERSFRTQGPNYNGRLTEFVLDHWDPRAATDRSPSLRRTLDTLDRFTPAWQQPNLVD